MRAQERTRFAESAGKARLDIQTHIVWLTKRILGLEGEIAQLCKQNEAIAGQIKLLRGAPGVGPVSACVLAALMPELGRRSAKTIAALAGVAPMAAESGQWRGARKIQGGRRRVRQALYMAALSAARAQGPLRAFYLRLRGAGKAPKQALIAVARKLLVMLNAMVRDNVPYHA